MGFSLGLLGVSVAVAAAVLVVAMPRIGAPGRMALFLRFAAVSGVAAVGSSAMYLIAGAGGGVVAPVLGDVAMVLAAGLLAVGVRVLDGRRVRGMPTAVLLLVAVVAVASAAASPPIPLVVKALALAVACGACAVAAVRSTHEPFGPLRGIAVVMAAYALFCLARVAVGLGAGWDSPVYLAGFSFVPATVVDAVTVALVGIAVVRVRFRPPGEAPAALCAPDTAVVVGDWDLASTAYGPDRMRALVADLRAAALDLDPAAADVPRGAEISIDDAVIRLGDRLRAAYGWTDEQTILLVDGAATAAIRTHPGRLGRPRKRDSARS